MNPRSILPASQWLAHDVKRMATLPDPDVETVSLSQNPQFLAIMERSRVRYAQEGGISSAEMRQRFGLEPRQDDGADAN